MGADLESSAITALLQSRRLGVHARQAWRAPKHFNGIAARLMRQVLVDYSRYQEARKRDAEMSFPRRTYSTPASLSAGYVALDECLSRLEHTNGAGRKS